MAKVQKIDLLPSFASDIDADIMRSCAGHISKSLNGKLYVSPLGRSGFSGARLYKCHSGGGRVFVVKIDDLQSIRKEAQAVDGIQPFFSVQIMSRDPVEKANEGALVYPFGGGGSVEAATEVQELHEIAYRSDLADKHLEESLAEAYQFLGACELAEPKPANFRTEYERYLRGGQGQETIRCVLGPLFKKRRYSFSGADCVNPARFIDDPRFEIMTTIKCGPVHGDFHPKNIMIDKYGHPHVIDFAWADVSAHRLKDFVLMECSLRFNVFPRRINMDLQRVVDEALLHRNGASSIPRLTKNSPIAKEYHRMAGFVSTIRNAADAFMMPDSKNGFAEYLSAQFLVLHGLLGYPDYHNPMTVRTLGMIAQHLDIHWHPSSRVPA